MNAFQLLGSVACGAFVVLVVGLAVTAAYRGFVGRFAGHPWQAFRARRGWGKSVAMFAARIDYEPSELARIEPRYRAVAIPKRSGGHRRLLIPDDQTKAVQRAILRRILHGLRAHPAAMGFEKGRSIVENALPHAGRAIVVNTDIVDFFTNTRADRVEAYFRRVGWNADAATLLTRLVTHEGSLPQGAPTSPRIANLVNFGLDAHLSAYARRRDVNYTRYADDLTFSFEQDRKKDAKCVRGILQYTRRLLKALGYEMHRGKTTIRRRHQRQEVTGLVVNDGVRLPRTTRRRLRAIRHHMATGREATLTREQMHGWDAFEAMVERRVAAAGSARNPNG